VALSSDIDAGMKRYPLQDLLELRRRDEESAAKAWAAARRRVDLAEAEAARIAARAAEARDRLQRAERAVAPTGPADALPTVTGAELAVGARYLTRLRVAATRAAAERDAFRKGSLAAAREEERRAAESLAGKHGAREASEQHEARFRADERRGEARREDEVRDDAAGAAHHARRPGPSRPG